MEFFFFYSKSLPINIDLLMSIYIGLLKGIIRDPCNGTLGISLYRDRKDLQCISLKEDSFRKV